MFRPDAIQIAAAHARLARKMRLERERRERMLAAGSCQQCGAEAYPGRVRCTDCGRKQAAGEAKRRAARKGNADE